MKTSKILHNNNFSKIIKDLFQNKLKMEFHKIKLHKIARYNNQ